MLQRFWTIFSLGAPVLCFPYLIYQRSCFIVKRSTSFFKRTKRISNLYLSIVSSSHSHLLKRYSQSLDCLIAYDRCLQYWLFPVFSDSSVGHLVVNVGFQRSWKREGSMYILKIKPLISVGWTWKWNKVKGLFFLWEGKAEGIAAISAIVIHSLPGLVVELRMQHKGVYANTTSKAARTSPENVTSRFRSHFWIIQSQHDCKICSAYPGIKLEPALQR